MIQKTILVNLEGFLYLQQLCCEQRGGVYTDLHKQSSIDNFNRFSVVLDNERYKALCDYDLGGGNGFADPSTWTSWSISQMALLLKKQGIKYRFGTEERSSFPLR